jgi:uncharacterized protein (DUF427 family)
MSPRVLDVLSRELPRLRYEPTDKRIRAMAGGRTVVDSTRSVLVWEPRRVVPSYAVPAEDVDAELEPSAGEAAVAGDSPPVLTPMVPFRAHTADGESLDLRVGDEVREGAAFRLADADLDGYLLLDFDAFDEWYEEDERNVGHPRNPFHRIDILHSSRHVRVELDGRLLAETRRPRLLFETGLPPRFYMPREDVVAELRPSRKQTYCAYKGQASYWSVDAGGSEQSNLVWSYEQPLREASEIAGLVCFFNEKVDIVVDGERLERPRTAWS